MSESIETRSQTRMLGLLEVFDRNDATVTRLRVTHWPVTVGRSLSCDLILDDSHIAAEHLRIEALPQGDMLVHVLQTINGVRHGKSLHSNGEQFSWTGASDLSLGRLRLRLRLPDMPIAAEQALPRSAWRSVGVTAALLMATLATVLLQAWLDATETSKLAQAAIPMVGGALAVLLVWSGLWALATKLFTGHPQYWRHVRIVCGFALIESAVTTAGYILAFAFSWESLARFNFILSTAILATGIWMQLSVIAPRRSKILMAAVATVTVLVLAGIMGSNWLQNRRASNHLYLSALFPPAWRMAPTVSVEQFIQEAYSLKEQLQERLDDPDEAIDDEMGDEEG